MSEIANEAADEAPPPHLIDSERFTKATKRRLSSVNSFNGTASHMAQFDCLERPLSIFFYKYGRFIAQHPYPFVVFPILLTLALSVGFLHRNSINDATYMFTPQDAASKTERRIIHDKWPLHDGNFIPGRAVTEARLTQVIARARGDGNILKKPYSEAVYRLNNFVQNRISVEHEGRVYRFRELCLSWRDDGCPNNAQTNLVADLYKVGLNITFPTYRFGSKLIYLASSMGGVSLFKCGNESNCIYSSKAWFLLYHLRFQPDNDSVISGLWEDELERQLKAYEDPYIQLTFFHSQTLTKELKRNAATLAPRFVVAFSILICFAVLNSLTLLRQRWLVDWAVSKPLLALCGVLNAGMGVMSAIGLLGFVGFPYNDIVSVMPFLVVSIGVDNMFLMVAAMRRTSRLASVRRRVAESLSDAAISISITALTDALSFGVGAFTTIPAVQIFCVYTSVAIVITFVYQLTFFVGLLVLGVRFEERSRHCALYVKTRDPDDEATTRGLATRLLLLGSRPNANPKRAELNYSTPMMSRFFRDWYSPVLMNPVVKGVVLVWIVIYLSFGVYFCTKLREGLEPINLLLKDSYAIPHYHWLEEYFWRYGAEAQIVVNQAPDVSSAAVRSQLDSMISTFANTRHSIGDDGVQYWFREFEHFIIDELNLSPRVMDASFFRLVRHFLATNTYEKWGMDLVWDGDGDNATISAFRFLIGLRDFSKTNDQTQTMRDLREIADRYAQYNVTTFMPLWLFADQYQLILPNTLRNIGIALACMLVISLLLIPQPLCALWVAVAIASIDVGVVGYMTLWGVNLDAISMITIIMSIGFSVDFSAHISYGYVISDEPTPAGRVQMALGALGWPILQGALSTVFGVAILATVDAYMIQTFFKTVSLVIVLGAVHGLVFLPVLLSLFVRGSCVSPPAERDPHSINTTLAAAAATPALRPSSASPAPSTAAGTAVLEAATEAARNGRMHPSLSTDHMHPYGPTGRYGLYLPRLAHEPPLAVPGAQHLRMIWHHHPPPLHHSTPPTAVYANGGGGGGAFDSPNGAVSILTQSRSRGASSVVAPPRR